MDVHVLGSGTLLPDDRHHSPAHLIRHRGLGTLLDCGSGTLHGFSRHGLDWTSVTRVVLTHFHTDHIGDLAPLMWAWTYGIPDADQRPRTIVGPPGTQELLDALAAAFGDFVLEPGAPLDRVELAPGEAWTDPNDGVRVQAHEARHTPEAVAVRVEADDVAVGYTGDTGPLPALGSFFRGVDVLVSECSVPEGPEQDNHMSPEDVAALAIVAEPARVVLTHVYPTLGRVGLEGRIRALGYGGELHVAEDGLKLEL